MFDRLLILENGRVFKGYGFGSCGTAIAEIVFNTSMVGYQEIVSDPSCKGQIVVMSYPVIGNYGLTDEDYESKTLHISGMVVRDYIDQPSNFRYTKTLSEALDDAAIPAIYGVDTREIVRIIRREGTMRAMITDASADVPKCIGIIKNYAPDVSETESVSTKKPWFSRTRNPKYTVVAVDCGITFGVIRQLNRAGCNVVVVPYDASFEVVSRYKPDGLLISNGPGNPDKLPTVVGLIKTARTKLPIFGIGIGHQLIGLAYGAKTEKMKCGHRGANHAVKNLRNGKIGICAQNHGYTLVADSLENSGAEVTYTDLTDGDVEGLFVGKDGVISVQFNPSDDGEYPAECFEEFASLMNEFRRKENA